MEALIATAVIGLGASYARLYLFHVVLALVALRSVLRPARGTLFGGFPAQSRYHLLFPAMCVWFAAGLAWSQDRPSTLQYLGYVSVGTALIVSVANYTRGSGARLGQLFRVARVVFLLDVAAGVLETLTPFRLPVSLLSSYAIQLGDFAESSADAVAYLSSCPTGFHWNPNNFAVVMIVLLPFILLHRRLSVRAAGSVVLGGLVFATSSRACVLAGVATVFLAQVYGKGSGRIARAGLLCGVGVLAIALVFSQADSIGSQKLTEASEALGRTIDLFLADEDPSQSSVGARQRLIRNGFDALIASGGLGIGGGADKSLQQASGVGATELLSMHNVWVELLVNGGLPLFLPLVLWYGALTRELYRHAKRLPASSPLRYYAASCSLAMIAFVPAAVSASTTIYMLPMYLLFGLAIATANVCREVTAPRTASVGRAAHGRLNHRNQTNPRQRGQA